MAEYAGGSLGGSLTGGGKNGGQNNSNKGANTANIIGSILGPGGAGSALSGVGDILCSIRGNCTPKVINQNYGNTGTGFMGVGLIVPLIVLVVIILFFYFLFKK